MNELALSLEKSAIFFVTEAIGNALSAHSTDPDRWPLALFHLVTSFEHAAKSVLAKQHPVFIREAFDSPQKSVGLEKAINRLSDKQIYNLRLSDRDYVRITSAVKIRNEIAHGLTKTTVQASEGKFFEILAYLRDFFRLHLGKNLLDLVERADATELLKIHRQVTEFEKRAQSNLVSSDEAWKCSVCEKRYLVLRDKKAVCLFCHEESELSQCESCNIELPNTEFFDAEELFEWEFSEDRAFLVNNFGIMTNAVCESCYNEISDFITGQVEENGILEAEQEYQAFLES